VTEIQANGRQTPAGETLCAPCYSALWGPATTDEFRGLVALHMGHQIPGRLASQPAG
jgi:hypothetical protein